MSKPSGPLSGAYGLLIKVGAAAAAIAAVIGLWFLVFPRDGDDGDTVRAGTIENLQIAPGEIAFSEYVKGRDLEELLVRSTDPVDEASGDPPIATAGVALATGATRVEGTPPAETETPSDDGLTTTTGPGTTTRPPTTTDAGTPGTSTGDSGEPAAGGLAPGEGLEVGSGTLRANEEGRVEFTTSSGVVLDRSQLPTLDQVGVACGAFVGGVCVAPVPDNPTALKMTVGGVPVDLMEVRLAVRADPITTDPDGETPRLDPKGRVVTFDVELVGFEGERARLAIETRDAVSGRLVAVSPDILLLTSQADRDRASLDAFAVRPGGRSVVVVLILLPEDGGARLAKSTSPVIAG